MGLSKTQEGNEEDLHTVYGVRVEDGYKSVPTWELPPKALGRGLVQDTSAHGISHIFNSRGIIKKILWLMFTLGATGYMIFTIYNLVDEYRRFEVNVKLDIEKASSLRFPAITICNQNMLRWSEAQSLVEDILDNITNQENNNGNDDDYKYDYDPFDEDYEDYFGSKQEATSVAADSIVSLVAMMNGSDQQQMGHQMEDLILECTYNKYECNISKTFHRIFNPQYGNCFIFNSGAGKTYKQSQTGPNFGLKLTLNIEQDEYLPNVTSKSGVRVLVHPQSEFPFPEDIGVDVSTGMSTSIGIRKVTMARLGGKYDSCVDSNVTDYLRNAYEQKYPWTAYTLAACQKTCQQRHLMEDCQCFDEKLIRLGAAFRNVENFESLEVCDVDGQQGKCLREVADKYSNGTLDCPMCIKACSTEHYQLTISSASWPASTYKAYLYEQMGADSTGAQSIINSNGADSNFLQVQIYFEELNFEKITEYPAYTIFKFMSDMGGAMGMCIGASFITALEFIELFTDLFVLFLTKCTRNNNKMTKLGSNPISPIGQK